MSISQYGIGYLSIVPIRSEASDKSEMISQLLFGEIFTILLLSENKKWVKIQNFLDKYEGWIDCKQFKPVSSTYYEEYIAIDNHSITRQGITIVAFENYSVPIVGGSTLPFLEEENNTSDLGFLKIDILDHVLPPISEYRFNEELLDYTYSFLGTPYLWGGRSYFGIDCSGFVQQIFRQLNIVLPRDAWQQQLLGEEIAIEDIKLGDLAFFKNIDGKIVHVGIILENNQLIHASGQVKIDNLDQNGISSTENKSYTHQLASIKRIL